MADKPKGNLFYEITIFILLILLLGTILYPKSVWQKEEALQSMCRARMEAIQQVELQYISKAWTYTDTLAKAKAVVFADEGSLVGIDSTVYWERLIPSDELARLLQARLNPESIRDLIRQTLASGKPLRTLGRWDSLQYRLVSALSNRVASARQTADPVLDGQINWQVLLGERVFLEAIDKASLPIQQKLRAQQQIRSGLPVTQTAVWPLIRPMCYEALETFILTALRTDTWEKRDQALWEVTRRRAWEKELDALHEGARDSVWQIYEKALWEKEKEILWKRDRKALWKKEKQTWPKENEAMWRRIISQRWEADRKKAWIEEQEKHLADSERVFFAVKRDSLWRLVADSIRNKEFPKWEADHQKLIQETIESLWQGDKRVEWESGAHLRWREAIAKDKAKQWKLLKDEMWNDLRLEFWKEEEEKLQAKQAALRRLDLAVPWRILGAEVLDPIVGGLRLPDARMVWKAMNQKSDEKGSSLYRFGIVGLVREVLIDSLDRCPVARLPYLIRVIDTTTVKKVSIHCPIVEIPAGHEGRSKATVVALKLEPGTGDTTQITMSLPPFRRLFGGASIRPHGYIDEDGKKSWERRGR